MSFAAGTNAYVDAIDKADTEVVLQGTADGGTVSVGKYIGEPKTAIPANDSVKLGGTGKNAMKFVDVKVDGATTGTAVVTVHYSNDEIGSFSPGSLFLAYFYAGKWRQLPSSVGGGAVSAEIPVSRLTGTVVGIFGDTTATARSSAGQLFIPSGSSPSQSTFEYKWIVMATVPLLVFGGIIVLLEFNRRNRQS